jgi:FtsH-binding integral membrane protein
MSQMYPNRPYLNEAEFSETFGAVMRRVYVWMFLGLLTTAGFAFLTAISPTVIGFLTSSPIVFFGLFIGELAMVLVISTQINRLSVGIALLLFFAYAALNGVTISIILLVYTLSSIFLAFLATACLFGAMSVIGYTTKADLTRLGQLLIMALLGVIIASVVNIFLASSALDWVLTYLGIAIFIGLIAYDTQRIKNMTLANMGNEEVVGRVGVLGALALYLDFINLFLRLLRVMGRRR